MNWPAHGFESAKLEYLLLKNVYIYDHYKDATGCLTMVQLFAVVPNALHELLVNAQMFSY